MTTTTIIIIIIIMRNTCSKVLVEVLKKSMEIPFSHFSGSND